jgi:HTH-type transcriptional regulator / antitoxin HigA
MGYQTIRKGLEQLMDAEPGSAEEDRLEVLGTLVWAYEQQHDPVGKPEPIAALEYYLESRWLDQKALEPYIGLPSRVWEVMNKRRPLSKEMIRKLEAGTGIPASILIQPYAVVLEPVTV